MGTCAGLIVLARQVDNLPSSPLGLIDISVDRNAYGRQRESFIDSVSISLNGTTRDFGGIFIRAPRITETGPAVAILGRHKKDAVLVRENNILACTFHPELTTDPAIHDYFLNTFI
jgi:5'-phosphate synthase pdxT subunit